MGLPLPLSVTSVTLLLVTCYMSSSFPTYKSSYSLGPAVKDSFLFPRTSAESFGLWSFMFQALTGIWFWFPCSPSAVSLFSESRSKLIKKSFMLISNKCCSLPFRYISECCIWICYLLVSAVMLEVHVVIITTCMWFCCCCFSYITVCVCF